MDYKCIHHKNKGVTSIILIIFLVMFMYWRGENKRYNICYRETNENNIYDQICFNAKDLLEQKRFVRGKYSGEIIDLQYKASYSDDVEPYIDGLKDKIKKKFSLTNIELERVLQSISYKYESHFFTRKRSFPDKKAFILHFQYQNKKYNISLEIDTDKNLSEWGDIKLYEDAQ